VSKLTRRARWWSPAIAASLAVALLIVTATNADDTHKLQIGATNELFGDTPRKTVDASVEPFRQLMERQTGYTGELVTGKNDAFDVARKLNKRTLQLGVFEGFEYAWVRPNNLDLLPLVIAVNQETYPRAVLVVATNSPIQSFSDLKGKVLAEPKGSKGYARLFLRRLCRQHGQSVKAYFSKIDSPDNIEDALDDAVDGIVPAVLVDSGALARFRQRKPGRAARLRELMHSPRFPAAVLVYHKGSFDDPTLKRFQTALFNAPDNPDGRQVLTLWKLTSFRPVPKDFENALDAIRKDYPPRVAEKPK